jgi:rsbT co-antagonist protein RsbR
VAETSSVIAQVLTRDTPGLVEEWLKHMRAAGGAKGTTSSAVEVRPQAQELLRLVADAVGDGTDTASAAWAPVRQFLDDVSKGRAAQGFTSSETATFILSLKFPVFERLRAAVGDAKELAEATWRVSEAIDQLALHTVASFQKTREEVIRRQQEEMLELSTPVVKLWDGVVALPMIGTLDSARTQIVMESLLQRIVETGAEIAIIDITGVPTVDTLVAQHLIKTVTAIRLMGADAIISGIRPQIAQTIVHLGIELEGVTTKASLADALALAFKRSGLAVTRIKPV